MLHLFRCVQVSLSLIIGAVLLLSWKGDLCTVNIVIEDNRYWHYGTLTSVTDTYRLMFSIEPYWPVGDKCRLEDVKKGKYELELNSRFGHTVRRQVDITGRRKVLIDLSSFYEKDVFDTPFLERMEIGDSLFGYESESGCLHWSVHYFRIVKVGDRVNPKWEYMNRDTVKLLDSAEVSDFLRIERYARQNGGYLFGGSTTYTSTHLELKRKTYSFSSHPPRRFWRRWFIKIRD